MKIINENTVKFNVGDTVYSKKHNCYGKVLDNYGNASNGDCGEIRLDANGNESIFILDENYKPIGYNLIKPKTYAEHLGKQIDNWINSEATLFVFDEKIINGKRASLVKKGKYGIDIFYKNGKIECFFDCKNYDEAKNIFDSKLKL